MSAPTISFEYLKEEVEDFVVRLVQDCGGEEEVEAALPEGFNVRVHRDTDLYLTEDGTFGSVKGLEFLTADDPRIQAIAASCL
jgi:hypothetical protein